MAKWVFLLGVTTDGTKNLSTPDAQKDEKSTCLWVGKRLWASSKTLFSPKTLPVTLKLNCFKPFCSLECSSFIIAKTFPPPFSLNRYGPSNPVSHLFFLFLFCGFRCQRFLLTATTSPEGNSILEWGLPKGGGGGIFFFVVAVGSKGHGRGGTKKS